MAKGKKKKSEELDIEIPKADADDKPKASKKDKSQDYLNHPKFNKFKN